MVRVYLKLTKNGWKVTDKSDFWIHERLFRKLKNLERILKKNWDAVIVIDGKERSGKSVLGMLIAWYLSQGKLGIGNFARGLDDAARKIASLPDRSVLIVDEGSLVFSSKDSMSQTQKQLIKLMDVVGQKNMTFIICLPSFFDLNKTIAVRRSIFFCHVYPDEQYNRGRFAFWGEKAKKMLYLEGKKKHDSYKFPPANFTGDYMNFEPPFYKDYLDKVKRESLEEVIKNATDTKAVDSKNEMRLARFIHAMKEKYGLTYTEMANICETSEKTIRNVSAKLEIAPIPLVK